MLTLMLLLSLEYNEQKKLKWVKSIFIQHLNAFDSNMCFALKIMSFYVIKSMDA